jgi:hypothetical protein
VYRYAIYGLGFDVITRPWPDERVATTGHRPHHGLIDVLRLGLILGILGGTAWLSLAVYPPQCVPVTPASEVFCNRLWSPALGAMLIGATTLFFSLRGVVRGGGRGSLIALVIGFALMTGGNVGEYWVAYQLPHQGGPGAAIRSLLWMSVLAGWLTALLGSTVAGVTLARSGGSAGWMSRLFLLPLPLTVVFAALMPNGAPLAVGVLGIVVGVHGLRPQMASSDDPGA